MDFLPYSFWHTSIRFGFCCRTVSETLLTCNSNWLNHSFVVDVAAAAVVATAVPAFLFPSITLSFSLSSALFLFPLAISPTHHR